MEQVIEELEQLSAMCSICACALDECEYSSFSTLDYANCLHHIESNLKIITTHLLDAFADIKKT